MQFRTITIPANGTPQVAASGYTMTDRVTMEAHPSNGGIIYVKRTGDTDAGYPLAAGASLIFTENTDLTSYTVSGAVGGRLVMAYE